MPHLPNWQEFGEKVGVDKTSKSVPEEYDKIYGTSHDPVEDVPTDDKLPTANMPKAPDPSPFTLGPVSPGGR